MFIVFDTGYCDNQIEELSFLTLSYSKNNKEKYEILSGYFGREPTIKEKYEIYILEQFEKIYVALRVLTLIKSDFIDLNLIKINKDENYYSITEKIDKNKIKFDPKIFAKVLIIDSFNEVNSKKFQNIFKILYH